MFQKILAALDHSEQSQQTFEKAIELAQSNSANLMLLHVISAIDEGFSTPMYPIPDSLYPAQYDTMLRTAAEQFSQDEKVGLEMLRSRTATATKNDVRCEFTQHIGEPGAAICTIAQSWGADLIVMGRRGRSGLTEFFLGSVSNYVIHHASCSVLIVQPAVVPSIA